MRFAIAALLLTAIPYVFAQSEDGADNGDDSAPGNDTFTTPPAPSWASATATITLQSSTWTTTYSSYIGSPDPTPAANPQVHDVQVGPNGKFVFDPPSINASVGDTVLFHFNPKNHTVTQSSFLEPCKPLSEGLNSGFKPVAANATDAAPTFSITVNDTRPIWLYCAQKDHCPSGMVMAINPVAPNTIEAFIELAKRSNQTSDASPSGNSTSNQPGASGTPTPNSNSAVGLKAIAPYGAAAVGMGIGALFLAVI